MTSTKQAYEWVKADQMSLLQFNEWLDAVRLLQRTEQGPTAKYSDIISDGGLDPRNKFDAPPQRTWVGLTDEEIIDVIHPLVMADMPDEATDYEIAKAIEAKLKELNT